MTEPQTNNNDDRTTTYRQVNVEWRHRAADERFSQLSLAYMQPAGWKQLSRVGFLMQRIIQFAAERGDETSSGQRR